MPAIKRFEELDSWKKARQLTREIYKITRQGALCKDFGLRNQIQRASVSIMSNIAEGFGYNSDRQFAHYLDISRASACEVHSLLYVVLDAGYIDDDTFKQLYNFTEEVLYLIAGFQRYLKK